MQRADYHRLSALHEAQAAAQSALEAELARLQERVRAPTIALVKPCCIMPAAPAWML